MALIAKPAVVKKEWKDIQNEDILVETTMDEMSPFWGDSKTYYYVIKKNEKSAWVQACDEQGRTWYWGGGFGEPPVRKENERVRMDRKALPRWVLVQ